MRLIDADELKKQIAGMTIKNHYSAKRANALRKLLDEQPTAFDIDEVVEQIEDLKEEDVCTLTSCKLCKYNGQCYVGDYADQKIAFDLAIKIVKGGAINADSDSKG